MRAASRGDALELLRDARFDPQRMAIVEDAPPSLPQPADWPLTPAMLTQDQATALRVEAEAISDGLLVLTDTHYPGWRAWVYSIEQPIARANYLFRGVRLPKGRHTIEFRYEPLSFQLGLLIAGATVALALAGRGVQRLRGPGDVTDANSGAADRSR